MTPALTAIAGVWLALSVAVIAAYPDLRGERLLLVYTATELAGAGLGFVLVLARLLLDGRSKGDERR